MSWPIILIIAALDTLCLLGTAAACIVAVMESRKC